MSQVNSDVDLGALARPEAVAKPPRRWLRFAVPLLLLIGFGAVVLSTMTELFTEAKSITVVRPVAPNASQAAKAGKDQVVVQAPGWVEPDPFPVHVTALTEGVVEELLVQESDEVEVNQVVARMIEDDARIDRDSAKAELAIREAEEAKALAQLTIATERLEAALEVTEAVEVAQATLDGAVAALALKRAAEAEGEAKVRLARDEVEVQRELEEADASGARQLELAQGALEEAQGRLDGLKAEVERAIATEAEARARLKRAEADVEKRFDDRLAVDLAEAQVAQAEAEVRKATSILEQAELRLTRMEIVSPIKGVVLERMTMPGMVLSTNVVGHEVCSVYDPKSLRIRVDIPQPDVERLYVGQRAEIESESRRGRPYQGEVLRIVQKANLAKVTLEAHVQVLDADGLIRPEMLAQVRFFGDGEEASTPSGPAKAVLVPTRLVDAGSVWIADAEDRARRVSVTVGGEHGEHTLVLEGLNLTDKLIDEGRADLEDGDLVKVGGAR